MPTYRSVAIKVSINTGKPTSGTPNKALGIYAKALNNMQFITGAINSKTAQLIAPYFKNMMYLNFKLCYFQQIYFDEKNEKI